MSKGGGSSSAPNPYTSAGLQTQSNVNSAISQADLNNVNVVSPYGSSTYGQTGTADVNGYQIPQFTQNIQLSPQEQQLLSSQLNTQNTLASDLQTDVPGNYGLGQYTKPIQTSFNQGQQVQGQVGMPAGSSGDIQQAENAAYNQQEAYLQPQQAQQTSQQNSNLANQGITPGSTAYNNAQQLLSQNQTFANQQAQDAAVQAGQQEQNTLYGQSLQSGEFANTAAGQQYSQNLGAAQLANTAYGQQFGQQEALDQLPYQQYAQLGGVQNPQANAPAQSSINPANISGLIQQNYQTQSGNANNTANGIYGLGAAGLGGLAQSGAFTGTGAYLNGLLAAAIF